MVQHFGFGKENIAVHIRMDITIGLPAEMAEELERFGICELDRCTYDERSRSMTASVLTTLYKEGSVIP